MKKLQQIKSTILQIEGKGKVIKKIFKEVKLTPERVQNSCTFWSSTRSLSNLLKKEELSAVKNITSTHIFEEQGRGMDVRDQSEKEE